MASAKALIDKFIADLEQIYKSSALATVQATLKDFATAGGLGGAAAAPAAASKAAANRKGGAKKAGPEKGRAGLSGSAMTSSAAAPAMSGASPASGGSAAKGKAQKAAPAKAKGRPGRMGRRSPGEIEATTHRILSYIKSHPMSRGEQIKKALGLDKAHWILPIQRLVETKQVIARGERRATTYSAPDAKPAAPAAAASPKPAAPKAAPAKPSVPPPAQKPGPVPPIKRAKRS